MQTDPHGNDQDGKDEQTPPASPTLPPLPNPAVDIPALDLNDDNGDELAPDVAGENDNSGHSRRRL